MVEKEQFKEVIVDSARQVFSRFGFKKTTMDDIAKANYKGKSSIYYYFTSKEEIYQAVVEKESLLLREEILKSIKLVDEPQEKLKNYVTTRMTTFYKLINFYNAIKSEYLSHLEFIDTIRKKYDNEEVVMIENILIEGVEKKVFNIQDTHIAAIAIVTAMKGLEIPLFWESDEKMVEKRHHELLNILFYGIVKR